MVPTRGRGRASGRALAPRAGSSGRLHGSMAGGMAGSHLVTDQYMADMYAGLEGMGVDTSDDVYREAFTPAYSTAAGARGRGAPSIGLSGVASGPGAAAAAPQTEAAGWRRGPDHPAGHSYDCSERPLLCMSVRDDIAVVGSTNHGLVRNHTQTRLLRRHARSAITASLTINLTLRLLTQHAWCVCVRVVSIHLSQVNPSPEPDKALPHPLVGRARPRPVLARPRADATADALYQGARPHGVGNQRNALPCLGPGSLLRHGQQALSVERLRPAPLPRAAGAHGVCLQGGHLVRRTARRLRLVRQDGPRLVARRLLLRRRRLPPRPPRTCDASGPGISG